MKALFTGITVACLAVTVTTNAQNFDNPVAYMSHIGNANSSLSAKYLSYISASSHGKNMKKVEKRRADLINSIYETRVKIYDMPSYNGDKSLRDSAVSYLKILYSVFNEDYSKLVNMEEIAEQSYDLMEAYLLAQEKAGEKLNEAYASYGVAYKEFAKKNNVTLVESESELERKLEEAGNVSEYYHQVYLIFFKCYKQEMYLIDALEKKNLNALEQNKNALIAVCDEGMEKLKHLKGYNSDRTLEAACKQVLAFLKDEAEKKIPVLIDFLISADAFEKLTRDMEAKSAEERTRTVVDAYNKAAADLNKKVNAYNNTNQQLNNSRSNLIKQYNDMVQSFMNTHMPYSR
jgi:hypothetical protein